MTFHKCSIHVPRSAAGSGLTGLGRSAARGDHFSAGKGSNRAAGRAARTPHVALTG